MVIQTFAFVPFVQGRMGDLEVTNQRRKSESSEIPNGELYYYFVLQNGSYIQMKHIWRAAYEMKLWIEGEKLL